MHLFINELDRCPSRESVASDEASDDAASDEDSSAVTALRRRHTGICHGRPNNHPCARTIERLSKLAPTLRSSRIAAYVDSIAFAAPLNLTPGSHSFIVFCNQDQWHSLDAVRHCDRSVTQTARAPGSVTRSPRHSNLSTHCAALYSGLSLAYGASSPVILLLSPITTTVIDDGLRYCPVIFCTTAGVTAFTFAT
jgi:hypothetical protein